MVRWYTNTMKSLLCADIFTDALWPITWFILSETLVLADTTGSGGMAPPTSTRIPARLNRVVLNTVHA